MYSRYVHSIDLDGNVYQQEYPFSFIEHTLSSIYWNTSSDNEYHRSEYWKDTNGIYTLEEVYYMSILNKDILASTNIKTELLNYYIINGSKDQKSRLISIDNLDNISTIELVDYLNSNKKVKSVKIDEMGYFGNIWVRKLYFPTKDTVHDGHTHNHDHISFLIKGSVNVFVDGVQSEFKAPTFITIKANKEHRIEAIEDDTIWYCVFALRDSKGELVDLLDNNNSPYFDKNYSTT